MNPLYEIAIATGAAADQLAALMAEQAEQLNQGAQAGGAANYNPAF